MPEFSFFKKGEPKITHCFQKNHLDEEKLGYLTLPYLTFSFHFCAVTAKYVLGILWICLAWPEATRILRTSSLQLEVCLSYGLDFYKLNFTISELANKRSIVLICLLMNGTVLINNTDQ